MAVWLDAANAPNRAPQANAGTDRAATVGDTLSLDGTASSDPDGDSLTYRWTLSVRPSGSTATLQNASSATPDLRPDLAGEYRGQLIVNDGVTDSAPDTVVVTATTPPNRPPEANPGSNRLVVVGTTAALSAAASSDPDGNPLTYAWRLVSIPAGSTTALSGASLVNPTLPIDLAGLYVVELVVSDGTLTSAPATLLLNTENTAPTAIAGLNQLARPGSTVRLDGRASADGEGASLVYAWSLAAAPVGSTAGIVPPASSTSSLVLDRNGRYRVRLVVNDGSLASAPSELAVNTVTGDTDIDRDHAITTADQAIVTTCQDRPVTQSGCERADLNGNRIIDAGDQEVIAYALAHAAPTADLTNDGQIDASDRTALRACLLAIPSANQSCQAADLNGDNYVDGLDEAMLTARLGTGGYLFLRDLASERFVTDDYGVEVSLNRLLVQFRSGATRAWADVLAQSVGGTVGGRLGTDLYVIDVAPPDYAAFKLIIAAIEANALVEFAVPNLRLEPSGFRSDLDRYSNWGDRTAYDTVLAERAWELAEAVRKSKGFQQCNIGVMDTQMESESTRIRIMVLG